jgi:hypothetical protein
LADVGIGECDCDVHVSGEERPWYAVNVVGEHPSISMLLQRIGRKADLDGDGFVPDPIWHYLG